MSVFLYITLSISNHRMLFVKASVTDRYIYKNNCTNSTSLNLFRHLLLFIVPPVTSVIAKILEIIYHNKTFIMRAVAKPRYLQK